MFGCKKSNADLIIGKWFCSHYTEENREEEVFEDDDIPTMYEFNKTGKVVLYYMYHGEVYEERIVDYKCTSNSVIISNYWWDDGKDRVFEIISLNENELILNWAEAELKFRFYRIK